MSIAIQQRGYELPLTKPENKVNALKKVDQAIFFDCASGTFYNNLFVVAVNTGLRPGELFSLTEENIDFEKKLIKVTNTLVYQKYADDEKKTFHLEEPKTKTSKRVVPMTVICEKALKKQLIQKSIIERRNIKPTDFPDLIFTSKFNTPLNSEIYNSSIERVVSELNLMQDDLENGSMSIPWTQKVEPFYAAPVNSSSFSCGGM